MNNDCSVLKDFTYIELHGMNIWIKDKCLLRNPTNKDMLISFTENISENPYAKGLRVVMSIKDFNFAVEKPYTKQDGVNEVTLWLTLDNAKILKDFLNKVI